MKIVYQGSPGAYSHLAAKKIYPEYEPISQNTFEECFNLCLKNEDYRTIIPVENSIAGRVADIQYLINKYKLQIYAEHFQSITHNLMILPNSNMQKISSVRSHTQAISQCQKVITENKLEPIIAADTAGSAKYISENKIENEAAIASELAAEIYNLTIVKKNIEDNKGNVTRFLIMGSKASHPEFKKKNYITSCIFKVKNKPAALYKCLGGFASNGVNITKLESYVHPQGFDVAQFYIDFEGHPENFSVKLALEEMKFFCKQLKILGVYKKSKFRKK